MILKHLTIIILCLLFLESCSLSDNGAPIPAFLVINDVQLETTLEQGYPSHQIEDVWVSVDELNLGIYPLPARIPIITSGAEMQIRINAGVKPNGAKNQSLSYPFYDPIIVNQNLEKEQELELAPKFTYRNTAKFDILDDFEVGTSFTKDLDGNFETTIIRTNLESNGGNFSGLIELAGDKKNAEFTTNTEFLREDNSNGATFFEFDYLSDVEIYVGYILVTNDGIVENYHSVFVSNTEWKRAYIDFTDLFTDSKVISYRVKFLMEHSGSGTDQIYLDNVKLVHF